MGFFDWISDAADWVADTISDVAEGVGEIVSDVAEGVGEIVSDVTDWVGERVSDLVDFVGDIFSSPIDSDSDDINISGPSDGTASRAKKIAEELNDIRERMIDDSRKAEEALIEFILCQYDKFFEKIRGAQAKDKEHVLNIDLEEIEKESKKLKDSIKGYIGQYYKDHLVSEDANVKRILKIIDDDDRNNELRSYCDKLKVNAVKNLKKLIQNVIEKQKALIDGKIQGAIEDLDRDVENQENVLTSLLEEKDGQERDAHRTQMEQIYAHGICEILGTQLEEAHSVLDV